MRREPAHNPDGGGDDREPRAPAATEVAAVRLALGPPRAEDARGRDPAAEALRAAFEQSPLSTVVYDGAGRPLAVNPAFERLWETTIAAVPRDYSVLTDPQLEAAGLLPLLRRAFGTDGAPAEPVTLPPVRYDVTSVTGHGRVRWTQAHAYPVRDAAGTVVQVVLTHQDITARIEAESALQAARADAERRAEAAARLAERLQSQTAELEQQVEESQALAEELEEANAELRKAADALAERARHAALGEAVGAALTEGGPLPRVLHRCCAAVVDHLGVAFARVWLVEEPAGAAPTLVLQASAGMYTNTAGRHARIPVGAFKIGRIAAERRPHLTNDLPNDPGVSDPEWARREGMRAFAGYPLLVDDQLVGVLALFARRALDGSVLEALRAVAERMAVAIQRHAAAVALRRADERTRRLQEAIAALNTVTSAEGVAAVIVEQGVRAMGASSGAVAVVRADLSAVDTLHSTGYSPETEARYRTIAIAPGRLLSDVVLSCRPLFFESAAVAGERYAGGAAEFRAAGIEAYAAIPIVAGDRTAAVLSLSYAAPRAFTDEDRAFVLALAEQCGQAMERVRLYEAEREARRTAERLQALTAALSGAATPGAVGAVVLEHGVRALGAHAGVVALTTADGTALEIVASTGYPPDACMGPGRRWPADASIPIADAARTGEPALVGSREAWAARYPGSYSPPRARNAAWAALPLSDGTPRGALLWTFDDARAFDAGEVALMQTIARLCGQAIERARLLESERTARATAEGANRAKSEFLSTMSHELRTPLNAIGGYVDLLDLELRGPVTPAQREDLRRIRRSAQVLMALVTDILNFARLDAGQVQFRLEAVRLDLALAEIEDLIAPQVRAKGLTYDYDSCGETLVVRADSERLKQVLLNLLSNAVKFTEPGGRIALSCEESDAWVRISVADTGRGIPVDQLDRVFEPFVQVDRHLTQASQQGVGLGLAISRDLARRMGGDLTAESTLGAGSTFTLTLPRGGSAADEPPAAPPDRRAEA
jgi:signal transduction histidine kinase